MKPLNRKNYGSISHLLGSKLGATDKYVHEGQHRIMTEKTRDKHDYVIVTEKYDGSNVGITKVNGKILAITRSGYLAETSPYTQHHYFAKWVEMQGNRFDFMLVKVKPMVFFAYFIRPSCLAGSKLVIKK